MQVLDLLVEVSGKAEGVNLEGEEIEGGGVSWTSEEIEGDHLGR